VEQWLADLIANVPLAAAMLIIYYILSRDQNRLEEQREQTRALDETARNQQIAQLVSINAGMQAAVTRLGETLAAVMTLIERHDAAAVNLRTHMDERLDEIEAAAVTARNASGQTLEIVKPLPGKSDNTLSAVQALDERLDAIDSRLAEISDSVRGIAEGWTAQGRMNETIQNELRDMEQVRRSMQEALQDIRGDIRDLLARAGETA